MKYNETDYYKELESKMEGDFEISLYDEKNDSIDIMLPYDHSPMVIELKGVSYEDRLEFIIDEINQRLDDMIDYIGDCKLNY